MTNERTDNILQIHETYIELPSGRQISLDCHNTFSPDHEFWELWRQRKMDVKSAGVFITKEDNDWRGHVRGADEGFSYSQAELHAYWVSKAEQMAEAGNCDPVIVNAKALNRDVPHPCQLHSDYRVLAKRCVNGTYQLRLRCDRCAVKTQGAIAWDKLGADVVIRAIALEIQDQPVLNNIEWV